MDLDKICYESNVHVGAMEQSLLIMKHWEAAGISLQLSDRGFDQGDIMVYLGERTVAAVGAVPPGEIMLHRWINAAQIPEDQPIATHEDYAGALSDLLQSTKYADVSRFTIVTSNRDVSNRVLQTMENVHGVADSVIPHIQAQYMGRDVHVVTGYDPA